MYIFDLFQGGRIDHAHHYNNPYRALDETLALDDAVMTVLSMVDLSDTLVTVTSDHSHVLTLGGLATPRGNPILGRHYSRLAIIGDSHRSTGTNVRKWGRNDLARLLMLFSE